MGLFIPIYSHNMLHGISTYIVQLNVGYLGKSLDAQSNSMEFIGPYSLSVGVSPSYPVHEVGSKSKPINPFPLYPPITNPPPNTKN